MEVKAYHRRWLSVAAEDNPNNARVPSYPGKGYLECRARGWIAETIHPHAGYAFFAITQAGEEASRRRVPAKVPSGRRVQMAQPKIRTIAPNIKS